MAAYSAMMEPQDHHIGRLLENLEEQPSISSDNTSSEYMQDLFINSLPTIKC